MSHRIQTSEPVPKLPRGVSLTAQGRYQSRIYRNGASVHLGVFDDVDEAAAAYRAAFLSRATMPIANAPAIEEPPPTAVVPETATTKPQERPKQFPPGTCPNDGQPFQQLGGALRCQVCGLQRAMWGPPGVSRADYASGAWRRRAE